MTIKRLLLTLNCTILLTGAALAQKEAPSEPANKGIQFSPALRKKVTERVAALRAHAAEPIGPMFDRLTKTWTIQPADCSLVKSPLNGTGLKKHTVWVTMNDDGAFHVEIRTEASGTAVDANGNKYIWLYNDLGDLDTPNPDADVPIATGSGPIIFQLIPVTTDGTGYSVTQYLKIDTPTPLDAPLTPVATTAPLSCQPL